MRTTSILHTTLGLDGAVYPDVLEGAQASFGRLVTGFSGLLGVLETQLGLTRPQVLQIARVAACQERLAAQADGSFFARSLSKNGWLTARVLLEWRKELLLAGWRPAAGGSAPPAPALREHDPRT